MKTKIASYHTADSKPVKQEVNSTVILPPSVFPALAITFKMCYVRAGDQGGRWQVGRWADGQVGRWADGQVGRWADGQMGRWADGKMGRWAGGQTY